MMNSNHCQHNSNRLQRQFQIHSHQQNYNSIPYHIHRHGSHRHHHHHLDYHDQLQHHGLDLSSSCSDFQNHLLLHFLHQLWHRKFHHRHRQQQEPDGLVLNYNHRPFRRFLCLCHHRQNRLSQHCQSFHLHSSLQQHLFRLLPALLYINREQHSSAVLLMLLHDHHNHLSEQNHHHLLHHKAKRYSYPYLVSPTLLEIQHR